eukprot:UN25296
MTDEDQGSGTYMYVHAYDGTLNHVPENERAQLLKQRREVELHSYYENIKDLTFKTEFINLSRQTAEIWRLHNMGKKILFKRIQLYNRLKANLEEKIKLYKNGAFVRLSTRSPKDAVEKLDQMSNTVVENLNRKFNQNRTGCGLMHHPYPEILQNEWSNARLIAVRQVYMELLKVNNADEAMELFMYSSRTVSDMKRALDYQKGDDWDLQVI